MNGFMRKFSSISLTGLATLALLTTVQSRADRPVTYVRRAEAAMILIKNAGIKIDLQSKTYGAHPDMRDGEWYVPFMLKGIELGFFPVEEGTGMVYPHHSVSRAEFLMQMTKAFGLTTNIPYSYTDVRSDDWFSAYAGLSWRYGLFKSESNPLLLQPQLRITHAEAAKAVYSLMTAEPQLQPIPGMFPVRKRTEPKKSPPEVIKTVADTLRKNVQKVAGAYVDIATPKAVKSAMLKMIQSQESLADMTRNDLIRAVNAARAEYNVPPLRSNYHLRVSAQRHAKDMAQRGYFSHFTPEGLSYVDRIRKGGYLDIQPDSCVCKQELSLEGQLLDRGPEYMLAGKQACSCEPSFSLGENLAKGQLYVQQVMEDWMNSPNHRMNLLRPEFNEIGIGLYEDLWVQNFGKLQFK